jgi:hypothetical protein
MIEISMKNCNAAIKNYINSQILLSNARAHANSIEPHRRPFVTGKRISELRNVLKANQQRVIDDCGASYMKRISWDE